MALQAVWVHGNVVVPEAPGPWYFVNVDGNGWTDLLGLRRGWGVTYRGKESNWFHAPIATPVIVNGDRVQLQRVSVFYNIPAWTRSIITNIHVWDGPNRIHAMDNLRLNGSHAQYMEDGINSWALPSSPWIYWGINIALRVQILDGVYTRVTFTTAGADFITP